MPADTTGCRNFGEHSSCSQSGPAGLNGSCSQSGPAGLNGSCSQSGPAGLNGSCSQSGPAGLNGSCSQSGPAGLNGSCSQSGPAGLNGSCSQSGPAGLNGSSRWRVCLKESSETVSWCPVEPRPRNILAAKADYPQFFDPGLPEPLVAEVGPGELLYLPSLWHHFVEQEATTPGKDYVLAVNFWYDMQFDSKWAYYQLVEQLSASLS
ncbi:hypothetical protein CEUSTIGMA_g948.t1 [Chlamydomonas eustigma]|uniref:Cupin-like domain-containing protein n=1 Tax=Chlamydomonas eustigma TaxID=1157962 RepID=A0A250WS17_9CHLO|nr:hypothetical protein CEUSTIGMA_g948.t1 [Chlamydomonas eustigma]|eukprot:GAX73496.1 hypothetical protein CEUSTIGMA_g948.t1 [Chlamydomonas eustigma]